MSGFAVGGRCGEGVSGVRTDEWGGELMIGLVMESEISLP